MGVGVCFRGIFRGRDGLPNTLLTLDSFSVGFLKDLLLIQAFLGLSVFVGSEEEWPENKIKQPQHQCKFKISQFCSLVEFFMEFPRLRGRDKRSAADPSSELPLHNTVYLPLQRFLHIDTKLPFPLKDSGQHKSGMCVCVHACICASA